MNKTLDDLRKEIDIVDACIVELLGKRMEVVKEIGKIKKELQQEVLDENRWQSLLQNIKKQAEHIRLNTSFVEKIYNLIHEHAKELEKKE